MSAGDGPYRKANLVLAQGPRAVPFSLKARLLSILPFLIIWVTLMTAYMVILNRGVRFRHALAGALIAAVLFELSKRGFGWYAGSLANYQQVYGAMSMVPISPCTCEHASSPSVNFTRGMVWACSGATSVAAAVESAEIQNRECVRRMGLSCAERGIPGLKCKSRRTATP